MRGLTLDSTHPGILTAELVAIFSGMTLILAWLHAPLWGTIILAALTVWALKNKKEWLPWAAVSLLVIAIILVGVEFYLYYGVHGVTTGGTIPQ